MVSKERIKKIENAVVNGYIVVHDKSFRFFDNIPLYGEEWRWADAAKGYCRAVAYIVPDYFSIRESGAFNCVPKNYCPNPVNKEQIEKALHELSMAVAVNVDADWHTVNGYLEKALIEFALTFDPDAQPGFIAITDDEYRAVMDTRKSNQSSRSINA